MPLFPEDTAPTAPRQQQRGQQAADPGEHAALRHLPAPAAEPLAHHHERRALLRGDGGTPIVFIAGCWRWRAKSQLVAVRSKQRQAASARPVFCLQQAQDAASFRDVRAGLAAGRLAPSVPPGRPRRGPAFPLGLLTKPSAARLQLWEMGYCPCMRTSCGAGRRFYSVFRLQIQTNKKTKTTLPGEKAPI